MNNSLNKAKIRNQEDRNWMVTYWAKYIRDHSDKDWSTQQKDFVDSLIE